MDEELRERLLTAPDDQALRRLIEAHDLNIATVEALKADSARFYFDRPAEALRLARAARRLGALLPDPAPALGQWTLANALMFVDRCPEAADLFDRARAEYLALDRPLDAARMGVGQVWALAYTGRFERALELAADVEPLLTSAAESDVADRRRLGGLFNNVGITHDLLGQYEEALAAYDRKLEIAQALGNGMDAARTQHNRACALTYLNLFDEALDGFREAEAGFREAGARADLARLSYKRGALYARWGRYAEAEAQFVAAREWLEDLDGRGQTPAALAVYRAMARLAGGAAPDEELLDELVAAQADLADHGQLFNAGQARLTLGRGYLALDELSSAERAFEWALALGERKGLTPLIWEAFHGLGNLAERRGDTQAAINYYERAIAQVEALRRDLRVGAFRAGFLTDKLAVYRDLALLYVKLERLEEAFEAVERAKSRLLVERLTDRLDAEAASLSNSADPHTRALAQRLQELLERLERLYRKLRLDEIGERGGRWPAELDPDALAEVRRLEGEALKLVREMERSGGRSEGMVHREPLERTQALLQDALLLQYHIAGGQVRAFVVDAAGIRAYRVLAPLAEVEESRRRFSAAVERALGLAARYGAETLKRYQAPLLADARTHLRALYELLIRPLASHIPAEAPLVISPDGALHYVPFHALRDHAGHVIERHAVSYTPSAAVLDLCARGGAASPLAAGRGMLVMGHSGAGLAEVKAELDSVSELFPEAERWDEADATARRLLAQAPRYRVLHLAAHARFRADNVMLSSFSLADRRLTLAEVSRLRLAADLVTLSGCETGRGRLYGADLLSLACGFLGAGARSLLVSLWRVDDATTAQMMSAFYRALQEGAGRAAALREAQLELLEQGYQHPAYWAPFVLIGEWDRLPNSLRR